MRLIDADALKERLKVPILFDKETASRIWEGWHKCTIAVDKAINEMPTIEGRKNVRGEWKEVAERGLCDLRRCSNCGHIEPVGLEMITPKPNFCPNCGADMRGGEDE